MTPLGATSEDTARRGQEMYERDLRAHVEPGNQGKYIVIDTETGNYEIGSDYYGLAQRMLAIRPEARLYGTRIGYPTLGKIGGWGPDRDR